MGGPAAEELGPRKAADPTEEVRRSAMELGAEPWRVQETRRPADDVSAGGVEGGAVDRQMVQEGWQLARRNLWDHWGATRELWVETRGLGGH